MDTILQNPAWFSKQKLSGKLVIGGVGVFVLFCTYSLMSVVSSRLAQSPSPTPTYKGADSVILVTWTPAGSLTPTSSATPTRTPPDTRTPLPTSLPTRSLDTATVVVLPATIGPLTFRGLVLIIGVNKQEEYVDIQNVGNAPVNLKGWVLVSEKGDQSCTLNGIIQPNEVLRIWAGNGTDGYSCGFSRTVWTDNELDPAVLYNSQGEEVSRYPPNQ